MMDLIKSENRVRLLFQSKRTRFIIIPKSGFAGVVMRAAGAVFVAAARYSITAPNVATAEALALLHECEMGASLGHRSIIFEFDSLESISCLLDSLENDSWEAFPILAKVKDLGESFQDCRWSWIPRSANIAADSLVSASNLKMCNVIWVDQPPSSLVHVLNNDGNPVLKILQSCCFPWSRK
nr:uncharacterized protein LOC108169546 [Malus domestica]